MDYFSVQGCSTEVGVEKIHRWSYCLLKEQIDCINPCLYVILHSLVG